MLAHINQEINSMSMWASVSYLRYTREGIQEEWHQRDTSFPLRPVSSSFLNVRAATDNGQISLGATSSFVRIKQERRVSAVFARPGSTDPNLIADIVFDINGKDILTVLDPKTRVTEVWEFATNKLSDQIQAFLEWTLEGKVRDARLAEIDFCRQMAALSASALVSDGEGRSVPVIW